MKILLFGRNGQLGWELQRSLAPLGEVIALGSVASLNPGNLCGDFTDLVGLTETVRKVQPHVIVNAAAYTAVDKAEAEPDLAHTVNTLAPRVLANEANALGAWLIHYSTDYVFDGSGNAPWREKDTTGPLSVYGQTKLAGEQAIATCSRYLTFRTSWVYAAKGRNFAKTMLRLAAEQETLSVITDQIGAPTSAELLADVTAHALIAAIWKPSLAGLYHCAAAGETSWNGYAKFVLQQAIALGWALKAGPAEVTATSTANYPTPARRPLNSRLDTTKLQNSFRLVMPHWEMQVARMLQEITRTQ